MNNNPFTSLLYSKSRSLYRKKSETILTIAFFAMVLLLINLLTAHAQFTSGRIVVLQVGDGSGALSNASTALYLKEFTTTGSPGILVLFLQQDQRLLPAAERQLLKAEFPFQGMAST